MWVILTEKQYFTTQIKNIFSEILEFVEILIPINGEQITMGDFFNKNTARFDLKKLVQKLYRHFWRGNKKTTHNTV